MCRSAARRSVIRRLLAVAAAVAAVCAIPAAGQAQPFAYVANARRAASPSTSWGGWAAGAAVPADGGRGLPRRSRWR